jgi:hypothetical protein
MLFEHQVKFAKLRPCHIPVEVMRLQIQRIRVRQ